MEVPLDDLKITSPTLIYFSGRETVDKDKDEISKNIYLAQKLAPAGTQVYTWTHPPLFKMLFNMLAYQHFPKHRQGPSGKELAEKVIMPLVTAGGQPLEAEKARKNLRNLTFFGFCAGSIIAQEIFNASLEKMQEAGYRKEAARDLLREVALVTIGTISRPSREKDRFTTVSLAYTDDFWVRFKNYLRRPLSRIFRWAGRRRTLRIKPISDTNLLVTAAARRRLFERQRKPKEIIDGVSLPRWRPDHNHRAKQYTGTDDKHNQLSRIVSFALTNAIRRNEAAETQTITPLQLLQPPAGLTDATVTVPYQHKIQAALVQP
jgi:hypothetical protein